MHLKSIFRKSILDELRTSFPNHKILVSWYACHGIYVIEWKGERGAWCSTSNNYLLTMDWVLTNITNSLVCLQNNNVLASLSPSCDIITNNLHIKRRNLSLTYIILQKATKEVHKLQLTFRSSSLNFNYTHLNEILQKHIAQIFSTWKYSIQIVLLNLVYVLKLKNLFF